MKRINTITLTVLIITAPLMAQERGYRPSIPTRMMSWISQTKAVYLFSKYVERPLKFPLNWALGYGNMPASEHYQRLGKEAQILLNIPEDRHVPIKRLDPNGLFARLIKPGAVEEAAAIYVNEERFNPYPYGSHRSALCHEASHTLNNDPGMGTLLVSSAVAGVSAATYKLLQYSDTIGDSTALHASLVCVAGGASFVLTYLVYHGYMERRADIQGHYATACGQCVHESAERRRELVKPNNNVVLKLIPGYLPPDALEAIAQDLNNEHKMLCAYHRERDTYVRIKPIE